MNEIDNISEKELDDQRKYQPRRDYYETALGEVSEYGTHEDVEWLKSWIIDSIKHKSSPADKVTIYRKARNRLKNNGNKVPVHSPLHRAGNVP